MRRSHIVDLALKRWGAIVAAAIAAITVLAAPLRAQNAAPASLTVISPIFGQLVRFSMPAGFVGAFENTKENFYIREAVLKGETVERWTQMITVTGARGMAATANFSPEALAGSIAGGFKRACPDSFSGTSFGETKFGTQDAFVAVASCGKVDGRSETALIVAVKGKSDGYTIQWAERTAAGSAIDEAKWQGRLRALMPIRFCAIVPGEAAPYPSCLQAR